MIKINKSPTADSRTCDYSKVSKDTLLNSSYQHIRDVQEGMGYFRDLLLTAMQDHDFDKISDIGKFHADFLTGFKNHEWWDNHKHVSRHHLLEDTGIPTDINLIDVIEMIVDCVMAGMARSGSVYPLEIKQETLMTAFRNTVELLKNNIEVSAE